MLTKTFSAAIGTLKGPRYQRQDYLDVLSLLYELLNKARREGFMSLEEHVENPTNSPLFANYPKVMAEFTARAGYSGLTSTSTVSSSPAWISNSACLFRRRRSLRRRYTGLTHIATASPARRSASGPPPMTSAARSGAAGRFRAPPC